MPVLSRLVDPRRRRTGPKQIGSWTPLEICLARDGSLPIWYVGIPMPLFLQIQREAVHEHLEPEFLLIRMLEGYLAIAASGRAPRKLR
jgi:hypothetical protein